LIADTEMLFSFEADFVESLRCIPMQVRLKLDTCGIKLKLSQWHLLNPNERQILVNLSCCSQSEIITYRELLRYWVLKYTNSPATDLPIDQSPVWLDATAIPLSVQGKVEEVGTTLTIDDWSSMNSLQRFALIKLSSSNHENCNFLPALDEFKQH
jgi:hypothetical protein